MSTPLLASAPLGLEVPLVVAPGLLLIGDAAGAPDPITGDGMALAFASVVPAADAIVAGDLESYQRARHDLGPRQRDSVGCCCGSPVFADVRRGRCSGGRRSFRPCWTWRSRASHGASARC
jgi:hypothetical protein